MDKSSTGLDANIAAGLAVVFGWISGLIFLLIEKDSAFVRFYAIQSLLLSVLSVACTVLGWVLPHLPGLSLLSGPAVYILGLLPFILWLILLVRAFQGIAWGMPVLGEFARKQAGLS